MQVWRVEQDHAVSPYAGTDREYAHAFQLRSASGEEAETRVEFAWGAGGSPGSADAVIGRYLTRPEAPPRQLVVFPDGSSAPVDHEDGAE